MDNVATRTSAVATTVAAASKSIGCLKAARTSPWCHAQFGSTRFSNLFLVGPAMSRTLIVVGLILVAVGLLWPWLSRIGLGRLPGDIVIERENFTFYAPIGLVLARRAYRLGWASVSGPRRLFRLDGSISPNPKIKRESTDD